MVRRGGGRGRLVSNMEHRLSFSNHLIEKKLTNIMSNGYLSSSGGKAKKRAFYKDYIELHSSNYICSFWLYHEWDVTLNTKWLSVMWAEKDHHPAGCSEMLLG